MGQCQGNSTSDQFQLVTEELPDTKQAGFSAIFRKVGVTKMEYAPDPETHTLLQAYNRAVKLFGDRVGLGTQRLT